MDATILAVILGTGGASAVLAAMITGLFSKRKLGAEATQIITNAAAGVVVTMQDQLLRSEKARTDDQAAHERKMEAMARAHVRERREWEKVLQLHVAWDVMAIARLAETDSGNQLPPPPPVKPAQRYVDDEGYPIDSVD